MKIIHNRIIPFRKYDAINICGLLFCRKGVTITTDLIQHERIHTVQMLELFIVGFYLWYFVEWIIRLPLLGRAYMKSRLSVKPTNTCMILTICSHVADLLG